ncbi:hypothetical protein V6K52_16100 [Knoellia sp. S7-12]|uniref:hypothetical protein n=1 Tax=Knoellia sp. S7-12 TaxID=3126698 RepID=UPI003365B51E
MTVIAFRPRPRSDATTRSGSSQSEHSFGEEATTFTGVFRSPRGRLGKLKGHLRLQRIVITPRGTFVTGVFTGELREPDGILIGVDSRLGTAPADLECHAVGMRAVVRPLKLDLMGITVDVAGFAVLPALVLPPARRRIGSRASRPRSVTSVIRPL